ncbi:MAG: folylpolyglutamate synthase/dihydrofolate synthase family protein [Planctomycetota bacterium]
MPSELSPDADAERFLYARIDYERGFPAGPAERAFKLDRMRGLLARLGDPQERTPAVHIAGTNGKGSTAVFTDAALSAVGLRVGRYTSPHLDHFRERIAFDGQPISAERFASAFAVVRPVVEELDREGTDAGPTFFEILTAVAWVAFAAADLDVVVLETGLGGRLDATNVCRPIVTAITNIGLDHTAILGDTLEQIASEKAGIAKTGVPLITAAEEPALAVIAAYAAEVGASFQAIDPSQVCCGERSERPPWGRRLTIRDNGATFETWLGLGGRFQAVNAALAYRLAKSATARLGRDWDGRAVAGRWEAVRWPGRLEVLDRDPLVIADGAHSPSAAAAVLDALPPTIPRPVVAVVAVARDKDAAGLIGVLTSKVDTFVVTRFATNPRAAEPRLLAETVRNAGGSVTAVTDDLATALAEAKHDAAGGVVLVIGSLFLVAEARRLVGD